MGRSATLILRATILLTAIGCRTGGAQSTAAPRLAPVRADTAALRHKLDSIADAHHGIVGYSVIDVENGVRMSRRGDEKFPLSLIHI